MSLPLRVVLASSDLNARARLLEVLASSDVDMTAPTAFRGHLAGIDLLVLDLDEGGTQALAELKVAAAEGEVPARVIGFMSHVDRELGRAAREAGCRPIARGRFWANLAKELEEPSDPAS